MDSLGHQVRTRRHNWILRQFRGETKPSKRRFKPSGQIRRTSLQVRLSEVASLYVSETVDIITWYGVWHLEMKSTSSRHVETITDFTCVTY